MIELKCSTESVVLLSQMTLFQGDLKKRTERDIDDLATSLREEGMFMPFAVWERTPSELLILDGHGRYAALTKLALTDISILEQQFPCIRIQADDENEARKALLQIVSTYGRINRTGVIAFSAPVIGYKAPVIKIRKETIKHDPIPSDTVIIKLKVLKDKAPALMNILKDVDGVEVY
jgi:hypothetical protein